MRKRLFLAVVCILTVPNWFSSQPRDITVEPFGAVALAGHALTGDWCECGTPGCIRDAGEICGNSNQQPSDDQEHSTLTDSAAGSPVDPGAGILMLAMAFFLWTRLRA
ncbi:MAG: hypothetical protein WAU45_00395 [Blastocatellia bacterium]